jgi:hypothetical protein
MSSKDESRESFLALSAALTGFNRVELLGTGQAEHYFAEVVAILGEEICGELWSVTVGIFRQKHDSEQELEKAIRREILADPKLGPVAKNITMMWYLARWYKMPTDWRGKYVRSPKDFNHVTSAAAYPESLVWRAIGAHPPAAKPTGFGIWSLPPHTEGEA